MDVQAECDGVRATLIDEAQVRTVPVSALVETLLADIAEDAEALGCAAAANITLNLVMIPVFGIEGAAAMTTLSLLGSQIAMAIMAWKAWSMS